MWYSAGQMQALPLQSKMRRTQKVWLLIAAAAGGEISDKYCVLHLLVFTLPDLQAQAPIKGQES